MPMLRAAASHFVSRRPRAATAADTMMLLASYKKQRFAYIRKRAIITSSDGMRAAATPAKYLPYRYIEGTRRRERHGSFRRFSDTRGRFRGIRYDVALPMNTMLI